MEDLSTLAHDDLFNMILDDGRLDEGTKKFVTSVHEKFLQYGTLTPNQRRALENVLKRFALAEAAQDLPSLQGMFDLFARADLKYPKIRFDTQSLGFIQISRAGERSKYTGQLMLTDGRPFGMNQFYGRVDQDGAFHPSGQGSADLLAFLARFSEDPVGIAREYGKESGNCCFCHRKLTDARSLDEGVGPVCAKKWGLPWGK